MVTVGVAGHIDHGKSSIVKRLTGVDPDRLPEERERGMTIDLGFARWRKPGGSPDDVVSFVDVPGHERFVRNMIAGAGGIEAIILVVAADDGWMPQSQEHFDIVRLLDVSEGLIVVTKTDLVDNDWLETVCDDIRQRVAGSFLEGAPIVPVSSATGAGFERLQERLSELLATHTPQADLKKPRLFMDRAFDMPGMGKVVTGSVRGGSFSEGDDIVVYPDQAHGKLRALQRHSERVTRVGAGQRAALAFTGIDRDILARGKVVATPEVCTDAGAHKFLIVSLRVLPDCPVKLSHRRELLFFLGSSEIRCELRSQDNRAPAPGTAAVCVLRCESEPLCFTGDHFIVRLPTPQLTVGGGVVLGWSSRPPKKNELALYQPLADAARPSLETLLSIELCLRPFRKTADLLRRSCFSQDAINSTLTRMKNEGAVGQRDGLWYDVESVTALIADVTAALAAKFAAEPHLKGLLADEVARLLPAARRPANIQPALDLACAEGALALSAGRYHLPGREQTVSGPVKREAERILHDLCAAPFAAPLIPALVKPGKAAREALGYLFDTGQAVKVGSELALATDAWQTALRAIQGVLEAGEELTVAELRSKLDTTRKYALPILEETDRRGITARDGDLRIKGPRWSDLADALEKVGAG
ncbi:MAG TPA: selenocysteine-specific translation elongation factor [candidate division Zixibacteria bacterium]|nr:selenocysteine-specific translation elongation factor [candidate division Zixibacteria bacterium]